MALVCFGRTLKGAEFTLVQLQLKDLLDTLGAQHHRHTDVDVLDTVLTGQVGRGRQDFLLIVENRATHVDTGRRGSVVSRAGLEQFDDLAATRAGTVGNRFETILGDQLADRDTGDGRVARQRHHGIAVAAEHHRLRVGHSHSELHRDESAEANRVKHAGLTEDAILGETGDSLHVEGHQVERVGDHDDKALGGVLLDVLADGFDNVGVHVQEVLARHTGFARQAGRHDDDVGSFEIGELVGAFDHGVIASYRACLGQVKSFALWDTLDDVNHDDVGKIGLGQIHGAGGANITSADNGDLLVHRFLRK